MRSLCVEALRGQRARQAKERLRTGSSWVDYGLMCTAGNEEQLHAAHVRRGFRRAPALVPGIEPAEWTSRDLRHSFVSLPSEAGCRSKRCPGWSDMVVPRSPKPSIPTSCGQ